jgi:hypothetical protein
MLAPRGCRHSATRGSEGIAVQGHPYRDNDGAFNIDTWPAGRPGQQPHFSRFLFFYAFPVSRKLGDRATFKPLRPLAKFVPVPVVGERVSNI